MGSNKASGAAPPGNNHPLPVPAFPPETQLFVVSLELTLGVVKPHGPPPKPTVLLNRIALDALLEVSLMASTFKPAVRHAAKDGTNPKRTNNIVFHALPAKYKSQKAVNSVQTVNQEATVNQKMQPT